MRRTVRIIQVILIVLGVVAVVVFGIIYSGAHYSSDAVPDTDGIYIYNYALEFSQQNSQVADERDVEIDPSLHGRYIRMEDVPDIASMEGVTGVYLFDDVFFLQDGGMMDQVINRDMETVASVPEAVYENYSDISGVWALFNITEGKAPADEAGEVALSEEYLLEKYGIEDASAAIGQTFTVNGEDYTLSGLQTFPFQWISFQPGEDLGYYTYDPETFPRFMDSTLEFWEGQDGTYYLSALVACEDENAAQQVQDQLLARYPASNYLSRPFVRAFRSYVNRGFWVAMVICVAIIAAIVVVTFLLLNRWLRRRERARALNAPRGPTDDGKKE